MTHNDSAPRLALLGGPKAADFRVPEWPQWTEAGKRNVIDCVESNAWCRLNGNAEWVDRFESEFADYHDAKHAIAVSNGTVAIQLALRACGVEAGDEVIVPGYTFIATASAVACEGAVPRFADVDPETYNIDPESVAEQVTPETACVVGVHFAGYPIDLDALRPVIEANDLFLIEDSAQAHGTEWRGEKVGTFGDVGTFSFQEGKAMTAGEGGIVVTDDESIAEEARLIHNIGRRQDEPGYRHYVQASNYRLAELQAALLCSQLESLPEQNEIRRRNESRLRSALADVDGIETKPRDGRITARGHCLLNLTYDPAAFGGVPRDRFAEALRAEGVPVGTGYRLPLYRQPAFDPDEVGRLLPPGTDIPDYRQLHHSGTETVAETALALPHQVLLADEAPSAVAEAIRKVATNAAEIPDDPDTEAGG